MELFQFHGLVEKGHEARVMMELNSEVVAHMYDKDYSGNNQRFAMFGQSIIVDMRVCKMDRQTFKSFF